MASGLITLTTDFGLAGPYVATMKGVILKLAPEARFIDVSHSVSPQNIMEGAFILGSLVDYFPSGTVHLGVVDPGVGTDRRLLAVNVSEQWFVVPDNGLITRVLHSRRPTEIRRLEPSLMLLPGKVSSTFHGRDVMAPAAAHLLRGDASSSLGPTCEAQELTRLEFMEPLERHGELLGEVLFRDPFGNLITNVPGDSVAAGSWSIEIKGVRIQGLVRTYSDRPAGALVALEGSSGLIEIAVVNGDAAQRLAAGPGTTARFVREPGP